MANPGPPAITGSPLSKLPSPSSVPLNGSPTNFVSTTKIRLPSLAGGCQLLTGPPWSRHQAATTRRRSTRTPSCLKAKCCRKCLDAAWCSSHECSPVCAKCGMKGHVSARHKHHEADTELYERIRKVSRRRKGSSASGPSATKCSKSVSPEEKDFEV